MQNDMKATVSLDASQAISAYHTFNQAIKANTAEWKANEASAKNAGDYQKANVEKVNGLTKALKLQKENLDDLKKKQTEQIAVNKDNEATYQKLTKQVQDSRKALADLKKQQDTKPTKELTAQIKAQEKSLNSLVKQQEKQAKTNGKGQKSYLNLTASIDKSKKSISDLSSQYSKAKDSLKYYNSGLADLQHGYKSAVELSSSWIKRLEAEGKTQEANQKKAESYDNSISILNRTLQKQEAELKQVEKTNGANSDAYHKQQIRVNETATSLAKLKSQQNELNEAMKKANPSFLDKMKSKLLGVDKEAKDTKRSVSDIVKGSFIGTSLSNGFSSIISGLKDAAKEGFQLATAGKETAENWKRLGVADSGVKKLAAQVGDIRGKTNEAGSSIVTLQKKFYAMTDGSIAKTTKLTDTLFAFGKQNNMTGEQIDGLGTKLSRLFSSDKVGATAFNKALIDMPGLKKQIVAASGYSKEQFDTLLHGTAKTAHITGQQLLGYFLDASKGASKAWEGFGKTTQGQIAKAQGTFTNFKAAVMAPIGSSILEGMAKSMGKITDKKGNLTATGKELTKISTVLGKNIGKGMVSTIDWILKHTNEIKVFGSVLLGAFASVKIITGISKTVNGIKDITKTFKGLSTAGKILAGGTGIVGILLTLTTIVIELYKHCKPFRKFVDSVVKKAKKGLKDLSKNFKSFTKSFKKGWDNFWNGIHKFFSNIWKKISKSWNSGTKAISSGLNSFGKSFKSGWNKLWNGVSSIFSSVWKTIKKLAKNAMNGLIDIVNGGISAVDNVIHFFGGKKHAIKLLGHVKFANGTQSLFDNLKSPITKPIIATLNDGFDSPATQNKEMLVKANGEAGIIQGRNTQALLMPGDNVINARETAMLMNTMGKYHFAKGTFSFGDFFSGIGNWIGKTAGNLKKYFDLATKIISHPIKYVESLFKWTDNKGIAGAMVDFAKGAFNQATGQVKDWWSALWSMASNDIDGGGSSSALLRAVEKYGEGHNYVWGASGPSEFDCSGLVMYALKKAFGISYPHFSGSQYSETQHISKANARSGDLVFWGNGGSEHVGVYAGGNKYFSAESPAQGIHMNTLDSVVGYGSPKFGRVKGLKQDTKDDNKSDKGPLQTLIKSQVGGFFKFISKLGSLFGVSANPAGDGVSRWKSDIVKALSANGLSTSAAMVAKIMRQMTTESGGNPNARQPGADPDGDGSGPALGLMQMKQSTFNAYAKKGHKNIFNGYDSLLASLAYAKARYGPSLSYLGNGHGYANGGIVGQEQLAWIAEHNKREAIIPLAPEKHNRAVDLLDQTTKIVKGNEANDNSNLLKQIIDLLSGILNQLGGIDDISSLIQLLMAQPTTINNEVKMDSKTIAKQVEQLLAGKVIRRRNGYA
ncbi:NlpC/P60 family protein [Lactobacillus sp. ESL0677]|uniref:NlpC/P60 family protein n=1 Tax=Lactobacillus sp. ESL0677 TaxID=2983208 RepID=UPI0023F760BB|nr:NlpC/P60 family protein [Lactobacillus sp. ESL0677]WEV36212.1 NlpC/P60 family protein [Lactobacillus sp. ESL0677]